MATLINDPELQEELIADRHERGIDRFDEVWDGVYIVAPIADNEHQSLQARLTGVLTIIVDFAGLGVVQAGANITDRPAEWILNYRVPDVLVFLNGTASEDRRTHWFGGPDFAVEIVSPQDRSREKIDFYSRVGVRELLIIDRDPWQLDLFHLIDGKLVSSAISTVANSLIIHSRVVPVSFRLLPAEPRPSIVVTSHDGQTWKI